MARQPVAVGVADRVEVTTARAVMDQDRPAGNPANARPDAMARQVKNAGSVPAPLAASRAVQNSGAQSRDGRVLMETVQPRPTGPVDHAGVGDDRPQAAARARDQAVRVRAPAGQGAKPCESLPAGFAANS
jgi:hypothetical protein